MSNAVGWVASLAALAGLLNAGVWLSPSSWFAGWVTFVLAAVAAVMAFMGK